MSETVLIWLFGGIAVWLAWLTILSINTWLLQNKMKIALILISRKAAELLHSPTNHLELDDLVDEYKRRNYELTHNQWEELHIKCERIVSNIASTPQEKLLALLASYLSEHKLNNYR